MARERKFAHDRTLDFGRWMTLAVTFGVVTVLAAGCLDSGSEPEGPQVLSAREAAEQLIAGPMATQIGLGALSAECPDLAGATAGDVFPCTASTESQRQINVDASILASGQVELLTTNVILGSALPSFEQLAVDAINALPDVTVKLEPGAVDCGEASVVLTDDRMMICALTDPETRQVFDISLTIEDIESRQFSLVVADRPRS